MAYIPKNKRYPTYPGMYEGITSDQFAANEGRGSAGGETKSKAKTVISKTFDINGQTDLEVDTDDDGIVTTKKIVTPAGVLDAMEELENYNSSGPFQSQSIAEPPEETVLSNDVTVVSEVPWSAQEDDLARQTQLSIPGYPDLTTTYSNGLVTQAATTLAGSDDDLAYWNPQTNELIDDENRVISRVVNDDGTVTYLFKNSEGETLQRPETSVKDATEEVAILSGNISALEGQLENSTLPGRQTNEFELAAIEARLAEDKAKLVIAKENLVVADETVSSRDETSSELNNELIIEAEEAELRKNLLGDETFLSDDMDLTFESKVEDAVQIIAKEDPDAIAELNSFADWANTVPDADAQAEAERYLQSLADEPSVNSRFKKAMAIAFAAMLFGDDFGTAMNTGFGVVADDYATEAAAAKEVSDANIALQKKLSEEYRSLQMDDYKSTRDSAESLSNSVQLANHNANIKVIEERIKAKAKRNKDNIEAGEKIMASIKASMAGNPQVQTFMQELDTDGEMSNLLTVLETQSEGMDFVLDLNQSKQRGALSGVLNKWVAERGQYGTGAAPLAAYAQEFFIKTELEEFAGIDPIHIAPSRAQLVDRPVIGMPGREERLYVEMNNLQFGTRDGTMNTIKLGKRIQALASQGLGEKGVTALLWKDYQDFKRQSYENFDKKTIKTLQEDPFTSMQRIAYNKGWGPFTQFVLVHMAGKLNDENIGMNFDASLKGESEEVQDAAMTNYMANGSYNIEEIKSQLKSKK